MSEIVELAESLRNGKKKVSELNWLEFQDLVFYLIVHQNSQNWGHPVKVTDFKVGEIDIIIEVQNKYGLTLGERKLKPFPTLHFIECKHHSQKITMATAAKIFCAGILHQPQNLIVVSRYPLFKQALEYADKFFNTDDGQGIFSNVFFLRVSLEQLLGINVAQTNQRKRGTQVKSNYQMLSWSIVESSIFSERIIISDSILSKLLIVDPEVSYSIHCWISGAINKEKDSPKITLFSHGEGNLAESRLSLLQNFSASEHKISFDITSIIQSQRAKPLFIRIASNTQTDLLGPIQLPNIEIVKSKPGFKDFRHEEVSAYIDKYKLRRPSKITFVHGDGGIGKSFFCEAISKNIKHDMGHKVLKFTVTQESSISFFLPFIWPLITTLHGENNTEIADNNISNQLLRAFFKSILKDIKFGNIEKFIDQLLSLNLKRIDRETLLFCCAKVIAVYPKNILFVIADCQKMSPELIKDFRLFLNILNDLGWSNSKFLIEYRTSSDDTNAIWAEFVTELFRDFKNKCDDYEVKPLSAEQIITGLSNAFMKTDCEWLSNILIKKTGGNPLYITQSIEYFINMAYIESVPFGKHSYKFSVVDFPGLQNEIRTLPKSITAFLQRRVLNYISLIKEGKTRKRVTAYLGLSALIGNQIDEKKLRVALRITPTELIVLRNGLVEGGFIRLSYTSPPAVFVHEIMKNAVRDVLKSKEEVQIASVWLIDSLDRNSSQDAIIGGKVSYEINNLSDAFNWFNIGFEIENASGNYILQRECLIYLKKIIEADGVNSESDWEKYLNISLALGWNEFQTSSIINAIAIYQEIAISILLVNTKYIDPRKKYHYQVEAIHNLLTSYVELLWPIESIKTLQEEILIIKDSNRLLHLLNRAILLCVRSNLPRIAYKMAELAFKFVNTNADIDQVLSVLYADIGSLYLMECPDISLSLWGRGLEKAEDLRQINHSKLNLLIANLYLNNKKYVDLNIDALLIQGQGVESQTVRLMITKGIMALTRMDLPTCLYYFSKSLERSIFCNIKTYEWQCHNNIAIYYIIDNQVAKAIEHFEKAIAILSRTIKSKESVLEKMTKVLNDINKVASSFGPQQGDYPILLPDRIPEMSGEFPFLLNNIKILNTEFKTPKIEKLLKYYSTDASIKFYLPFIKQGNHPLVVIWRGKELILSIN